MLSSGWLLHGYNFQWCHLPFLMAKAMVQLLCVPGQRNGDALAQCSMSDNAETICPGHRHPSLFITLGSAEPLLRLNQWHSLVLSKAIITADNPIAKAVTVSRAQRIKMCTGWAIIPSLCLSSFSRCQLICPAFEPAYNFYLRVRASGSLCSSVICLEKYSMLSWFMRMWK